MYDQMFTHAPRNEDHLWEMIADNFEHARHVLTDFPVETRDEALRGEFRSKGKGKMALVPLTVLSHRNASEEYDQRDYCLELGRTTLPVVRRMIKKRQLTPAFFQSWGVLQFCHGYLASHLMATNDEFASERGASRSAETRSVAAQRVWVARILLEETRRRGRKDAERVVEALARAMISAGGHGEEFPPEWFEAILDKNGNLKRTYGKGALPIVSLGSFADRDERVPPIGAFRSNEPLV